MRLRPFISVALVAFSFSATVFAADGSSGCGPAWYIFKDNSLLSSSSRAVTNNFLSPVVTFGMTSGTSNCAKHSFVQEDQQSLHLAAHSLDTLRQDIARGDGPHLSAYIDTFGCGSNVKASLAQELQKAFAKSPELIDDASSIVKTTEGIIANHPELKGACS